VSKSDLFAYLAAFVSIVLAVALSDMIQSTHRLIRARDRVKWDPLTPLLALSVFTSLLAAFFSLWGDARFERLTYYGLLAFMVGPVITALVAFAVLPDDVPDSGLDLRQFFFNNRRYLAVLFAMISVNDVIWTVRWASMMNALNRPDFWWHFAPVATINAVLIAVLFLSKSWRVQLAGLIASLVLGHFGFGGWYIDTVPTAAT
jgi:hypothetical protein